MPSSNETIRVDAQVTGVKPNGWAIAQVLRTATAGSGTSARRGQTIAVQARYGKKVGDQFKCDIVPNDRGQDDWFAIRCVTSEERKTSQKWAPWQASKTNPLSLDLPTTISGTPHDGIKLGCWCCGKLLIGDGDIHRIKDTSVWTNSGFDSANFIFDREREQYNKFKKCKFVPVRCGGCKQSVATLYETKFWDSDTEALITDEMQPVPCLKVTSFRKPPGGTSFEHHTVLLGEEGTVKDAIDSLTTHEIHEINKLLPRLGRVGQDDYATRRALREANGAEIKLLCNVCGVEESSLKGIRCPNKHFTCDDCFNGYVSISVCDNALSKGCLEVKCAECIFVFEDHAVCLHVNQETYQKFDETGKKLREQKAIEEEKERLEEESQRRLRMGEEERKINDARKTITEDILTLKCPSCKAAFVDFDGCFALSCKSCPCRFCAGCLAPAKDGHECHRHVSACEVCRKAGVNGYFGTFPQFEQIHKTRRSKLMKEFLERPDMRELAGKVVEAMRKDLEDLNLHDIIISSYVVGEHRPRPEVGIEKEPVIRIYDKRDYHLHRGNIIVEVELPGVESAKVVDAKITHPTPNQSILHVQVPGMYKADVRLPVKIDEDQMWPGFISMNQWMVYYFGCP
jgi:hypothetical protein